MGYNALVVIIALFVAISVMGFVDKVMEYRKSKEDVDSLKKSFYKLLIALITLIITILKEVF